MSQAERSPSEFRPDVQGLRAVAVGLVILYHFNLLACSGGFVGVDVFFVISGFVISGVILREVDSRGRLSLAGFYARRARRILPASTITLVVTVCVAVWMFGRLGAFNIAHDGVAAALFMANFHFASQNANYFSSSVPPSPLLHFWSLAVEEQFYFVIPTIVLFVTLVFKQVRTALVVVMGALVGASFIYSMWATSRTPTLAYYSIGTRAWELGVGVLASCVVHRCMNLRSSVALVTSWTGVAFVVASAWFYNGATPFPGFAAALPVLGTAMVILADTTTTSWGPRRLLSSGPFVKVGDMSYSLYLWHFPVLILAQRYWSATQGLVSRLVLLAVVVAISFLSYQFVETPIRSSLRLRRSVPRSLTIGSLCVGVAIVVSIVPTVSLASTKAVTVRGHPALNKLRQEIAAGTKLQVVPSSTDPQLSPNPSLSSFSLPRLLSQCTPAPVATTVPLCTFGDPHAAHLVVLYGNSQAQSWLPALDALGRRNHFRLIAIAKPACGTFVERGYIDPLGLVSNICQQFVTWSVTQMNRLHPSTIIVSSTLGNLLRPGASPNQLGPDGRLPSSSLVPPTVVQASQAFRALVHALAPSRARVVLLGNIPVPLHGGKYPGATTPNDCLIINRTHVQTCSLPEPTIESSKNRLALTTAAMSAGVPFINLDPLLCAAGTCPAIVNRILVHFDTLHVSAPYATYVSSSLGELLGKNLP